MSVERLLVEKNVVVPMRDGINLFADVYRPTEGRWPVLVMRTPYSKDFTPGTFAVMNPVEAATAGYAVVVQDTRGRGRSGGHHLPFVESDDGYDSVAWAAEQPWSNGRVGMFGSSYMAATQMQAAIAAPEALVAIAPVQASSDYYEGRTYWDGAFEFGALTTISMGTTALGSLTRSRLPADERAYLRRETERILSALTEPVSFPLTRVVGQRGDGGAMDQLTPWFFDWCEHRLRDAYWADLAIEGRHEQIDVRALHVTSWNDAFHMGALRNFVALRSSKDGAVADGQHLLVGPWDHYALAGQSIGMTRVGDRSFGPGAAVNLTQVQLRWFRHWLGDGRHHDMPRVRYFTMGINQWRDVESWPPADSTPIRLFLQSSNAESTGSLTTELPRAGTDRYDYNPRDPVPTRGGAHLVLASEFPHGPVDQRDLDGRRDILRYLGSPLEAPMEVTGYVDVDLWVDTSAASTDFTARLVDVAPDGLALGVCDGIRRIQPGAVAPGVTTRVRITLGATSHCFLPGHRVRLDVSSSNYPRFDPNPNNGLTAFETDMPVVAHQTVFSGAATPSALVLPVRPHQG